ncbi:MAG: EAL domain-containing protein [Ruminococcaceae bacterium]|nr:EAL domain-containing protein [Oscillospiraceae bacterium]
MENRKNTLLIVDDTDYNIELLSNIFQESYRILTAKNGRQALEIMRSRPDEIDAVLLDVVMPEMDGYQVLLDMSMDEHLKYLPVIVITADGDPESEHKAFDYGAYDFITRPFNFTTVEQRVHGVFRQRELEKMRSENEELKREAETEKHLSALMDNLPGGVAIIETDGSIAECTYFNSSVPKLFHMTDEEFAAEFTAENAAEWLKTFMGHAADGSKFDYAFSVKDKDGEDCWIRMIASGIEEKGNRTSLYCVFLDINAEKRHEQRAAEADERLRQNDINIEKMINNAPGGIAMCEKGHDGKMHVLYSSRGLADIFGYPDYETYVEEVEKGGLKMISETEAEYFRSRMSASIITGKPLEYTFHCQSYQKKPLWILVRAQFIKNEAGRIRLYCFISDTTKEKEYEIELKNSAYYDSLTGLYNRSAFYVSARELLKNNPDVNYAVYRINIGSFKVINDIMGREIGDRVLISIATALNRTISQNGLFSRFFSDNFMVMVPENTITPEEVLKEIGTEVENACLINQDIHYYIGVYIITDRITPIEDICDRASIACRSVNGSFSNHIAYYDSKMRDIMIEEQEIRAETHRAIVKGEFCIYYQPIYGVRSKKFVCAEALVRWVHPTKGIVPPGKFIPVFERNGFIAELDLYVLEQVCKYHQKRREMGLEPFPISVNISRMSLYNPSLFDVISRLTERYGVEPKYFRIEITETAYNDNPAQLLETVNKLRENGFPVLMDDFGSGYSSLNTLKDIPIDMLKLDMKFMQGFEDNDRVGTIVTAVSRMSKWLDIPMLAEGVETKEQYDFLRSIGCAYIQGYYFSRPVPEDRFTELVQKEEAAPAEKNIERYGLNEGVNEILGSNATVSKLLSGVFGGLGIYELYDDKLEVIRVNEGYMQIMGYSPDEFTGEHYDIWQNVHPDDIEKSKNACIEAAKTGKTVRAVVKRYDRNGNLLYLDGMHKRLGGTDENPILCIAFNDITEQLENEAIIRKSRRQIDTVLDTINAMAVDIDFTTGESFCSGVMDEFGFSVEELAEKLRNGEGFESVAHPDDVDKMKAWHADKTSGRYANEFRIKIQDGKYRWFRFVETRAFDENGMLTRLTGLVRDIDVEKNTSLALEDTRTRVNTAYHHLESVINNLEKGLALIIEDEDKLSIAYANKKFFGILKVAQSESEKLNGILKAMLASGEGDRDMTIYDTQNGSRIIRVHLAKVDNINLVGNSYIVSISDVTAARAKSRMRVKERKAYAASGMYNEVFELDYAKRTLKLVSSMRHPERAERAKLDDMDAKFALWGKTYLHPADREAVKEFLDEPEKNADFTDNYIEARLADPEDGNKYKIIGMALVRSGGSLCMLYTKSAEAADNATLNISASELRRLYNRIAEQTNTAVIEYDHITNSVECSANIKDYAWGTFSDEKLKDKESYTKTPLIHSNDKELFNELLKSAEKSDKPTSMTLRMKMADGGFKWCRLSLSFIKNIEGTVIKSLCTINIVDEEIRTLRKLDESEAMLAKTVKNIPVGIGIYNVINSVPVPVYVSDSTYRVFGAEPGEVFEADSYLESKYYRDITDINKPTESSEGEYTCMSNKRDGTPFWLNVKYRVMNEDENILIYAALSDVSDKVKTERAQEVQNELYQLLLDETGTIIFDYDTESDQIAYYRHLADGERKPDIVKNLHSDPDKFTLLEHSDKQRFINTLDKLAETKGTEELSLTVKDSGYSRHYRSMFKSINDASGKVFRIIGKIEDVEDEMAWLDEIQAKAMYDSLCVDIYNKATTEEFIKSELKHTTVGALLMIDIDDFKSINDRLGHLFGDEFLKQFAATVKSVFRESDIVGRYGGDEFFVFLNHANTSVAVKKGEAILEKVAQIKVPQIGQVRSSIGVSTVTPDNRDYRQLVKQADSALYQAKNRGKNCIILFDPDTMSETTFRAMENGEKETERRTVALSSNPSSEASLIMRVFSALQSSSDIKTSINQMLALIGKHFDVSRAYIFEDSSDGLHCSNTYEWCGEGVASEMDSLQNVSYKDDLGGVYHESLNEDGILYCHDIKTLNSAIRDVLERQGIKSILHCAIIEDGKFKGFVGFDECRANRFWTQDQIDALTYISKVLATFLLNERNKNQSRQFSRSIETILYKYPEYIYIIDPETHKLLYLNKMTEELIGRDKIGTACYSVLCDGKNSSVCPIRELMEKKTSKPVEMVSPVLKRLVRAHATSVEWDGKEAYMVSCLDMEGLK